MRRFFAWLRTTELQRVCIGTATFSIMSLRTCWAIAAVASTKVGIASSRGAPSTKRKAQQSPRTRQNKHKCNGKTSPTTTRSRGTEGWRQIASFLGEPTSVAQRWAAQGMPVRRQGRYVTTTPDQLNAWLERESGKPVHVATNDTDLAAELKRGISFLRREQQGKPPRSKR